MKRKHSLPFKVHSSCEQWGRCCISGSTLPSPVPFHSQSAAPSLPLDDLLPGFPGNGLTPLQPTLHFTDEQICHHVTRILPWSPIAFQILLSSSVSHMGPLSPALFVCSSPPPAPTGYYPAHPGLLGSCIREVFYMPSTKLCLVHSAIIPGLHCCAAVPHHHSIQTHTPQPQVPGLHSKAQLAIKSICQAIQFPET